MRIQPKLKLVCHTCGWRPHETQTALEMQKHMIDAHQTEEVHLDLIPFCTCGSEMDLKFTEKMGDGFRDHYRCNKCGNEGFIERTK